jgi:lipopolysaccharide/colanic/teichoic acid biosynthesis glycosyltransferase
MSAAESISPRTLDSYPFPMTPSIFAKPSSAESSRPVAVVISLWRSAKMMAVSSGRGMALVRRDLLVVGTDATAGEMRGYLGAPSNSGYRFRGLIADAEDNTTKAGGVSAQLHEIFSIARAMFVDKIVLSTRPSEQILAELCEQARSHHVNLRYVPNEMERLCRASEVQLIGKLPTIVAYQKRLRPLSMLCKRLLDITLSSIALVILSPLFAAIALVMTLHSDGPLLHRSERLDMHGRTFGCYKFRTMVCDADRQRDERTSLNERFGLLRKISKSPRITPLGAWLERYSLDKLPQLFNVLRGEMSLVGPQPSLPSEAHPHPTADFHRLDVMPGMTGLWQVEAPTGSSFNSYVDLDNKYANEWSLWLDLTLLFRTVHSVFRGTGVSISHQG